VHKNGTLYAMAVHVYITEIRFLVTINNIKTNKHVGLHVDNADLTLFADDNILRELKI